MGRPKIIVNVACSFDGMIASKSGPLPLSTEKDWIRVHQLRNSVDAIFVGINTILIDNPLLTVRYVDSKPSPPQRVVLDTNCRIPLDAKILLDQDKYPTIIFTSSDADAEKVDRIKSIGAQVIHVSKDDINGFLSLSEILRILFEQFNVKSVLVEGGSTIISQFIQKQPVDKMYVFFAPYFVGSMDGIPLFDENTERTINESTKFVLEKAEKFDEGLLVELKLRKDDFP
ncbi:MAG: dihydrofolate reductase family protein [Candidatus Heimdallarchaeota archaeon]|nr:dihydrofolate reductase family protein [Candidatus Heimdallarchaeota archaeon]MCK4954728.1 dihydrofolate reductase family protein [Candidatus Heimdallarchaeota archaeon]